MIMQLNELELDEVNGGFAPPPTLWDKIKDWFSGDGNPRPDPSPTTTNV
jgi:hypothetical protein